MGAGRAGLVQEHPDHRRHAALVHRRGDIRDAPYQAGQVAAEAMGEIRGRIARACVAGIRITGRQQDPAAHVDVATPERAERRADEVQQLGLRTRRGHGLARVRGCVFRHDPWVRTFRQHAAQCQGRDTARPAQPHPGRFADDVAGTAPAVVVVVVGVEHRLQVVVALGQARKRLRECDRIRIQHHACAGGQRRHLHRGDGHRLGRHRAGINRLDLAILRRGFRFVGRHREHQQAARCMRLCRGDIEPDFDVAGTLRARHHRRERAAQHERDTNQLRQAW